MLTRLDRSACLIPLLLLALLACALPSRATSYVPMTDEALVDGAPLIAVVEVIETTDAGGGGRPVTDTTVHVVQALKGLLPQGDFVVRVPGGLDADGRRLRIDGAPSFSPGERALLFLSPRPDGTLGVYQLFLGAFHEIPASGGRRLAVRRLDGVRAMPLPGRLSPVEPARDFELFVAWIAARVAGVPGPGVYELAAGREERLDRAFKFFQVNGRAFRWFDFDSGASISWRAHQDGQPGLTGGGFSEFQTALAAWTNDPGSRISYTYVGTTTSTGGFTQSDGSHTLLFNDPNQDISGSFQCGNGGVLAIGGFWDDASLFATFSGLTYYKIPEADIVTNDGIGCFVQDLSPPSETAQELFAHELGHTLGLDHSTDSTALMWPFIHADGRGAHLETDETAAAGILYRGEHDLYTLTPCRLFDSRGGAPLSAGSARTVPTQGLCAIPGSARALVINVTAVSPTSAGYLTLFPQGETVPVASSVTYAAGVTRTNNAVVNLAAYSRSFDIQPGLPAGATVHVTVDVVGYFE